MTHGKKRIKELHAAHLAKETKLNDVNDAYTKGAFKFVRLLLHILGAAQFIFGIYFYWFKVHYPEKLEEEEDLKARWGGKFKYLTFVNVIMQAIYHTIALLNDFFGTNAVNPASMPVVLKIRDYIFSAWAFPMAQNVCISFWVIYVYDRELIFPSVLDVMFPSWLNHIVHTNVFLLMILDLFMCFRQYPSRLAGIGGTSVFMLLYIIWVHIVRYFSGQWVYPLLEVLSPPLRYAMFSAQLGFSVLCYLLGEWLNSVIWRPEMELVKLKMKDN